MPSSSSRKRRRREQVAAEQLVKNDEEIPKKDVGNNGSPKLGLVQFINQVFSENKSRIHRLAVVDLLCDQMTNMALEDIFSHAQLWIGHLMQTMESHRSGNSKELALCSHTLSQLLILCNGSPELRRTISLTIVPKLLTSLLGAESTAEGPGLLAIVNLMKVCIKYFGGSCLSFKNKLETYVLKIAVEVEDVKDSLLLKTCLSTLSYLPCCGGQGSTGNKHSEMWTNQLARLLHATSHLIGYLYTPCDLPNKDLVQDVPLGQPFPVVEEDVGVAGLTLAARYLQVYVKALQVMLSTSCTWKVQLPVKHLLAVVCHLTSVTPDSVMFNNKSRRELQVVCKSLPSLHTEAMSLMSSLIHTCGSCLYPYTTTICELISSELQWTKAAMEEPTDAFITTRVIIHQLITDLLSQPGLSTMGSSMAPAVVEHALVDLSLSAPVIQVDAGLVAPAAKRSRKLAKSSCTPAVERLLKLSALTVVKQLLQYLAGCLSMRHLKMVYDRLVAMAVTIQSGATITCYSSDAKLRYSLYDCLLASIHSYNLELGPLTHISLQLIRNGLTDTCPLVRCLCNQGLLSCKLAVAPRSLPLVQYPSAFTAALNNDSGLNDGELPVAHSVDVEGSRYVGKNSAGERSAKVDSSGLSDREEPMEVISPPASSKATQETSQNVPVTDVVSVSNLPPPIESNPPSAGEEQDDQSDLPDVVINQSTMAKEISTGQSDMNAVFTDQSAEEKSADQSAGKSVDQSAEKSADQSAEKSADQSAEKSADQSAEKSADQSAEKSADQSAEEMSADQSAEEKSADQSAEEKSADQSASLTQEEGKSSPLDSVNEEDPGADVLEMMGDFVTDGPDQEEV